MNEYLMFHISFLSIGAFAGIAAGLAAFIGKRSKCRWLTQHRLLAVSAWIFTSGGIAAMIINKMMNDYSHFKTLHAILGLVYLIMLTFNISGGLVISKKKMPAAVRMVHRLSGAAIAVLGLVVLLLGFFKFL